MIEGSERVMGRSEVYQNSSRQWTWSGGVLGYRIALVLRGVPRVECSLYKQPGSANFLPVVSRDAGWLPLQTLKLDDDQATGDNGEEEMLPMMRFGVTSVGRMSDKSCVC